MTHGCCSSCRAASCGPTRSRRWRSVWALPLTLVLWGCGSITSDWRDAEEAKTPEAYQDFLKRYPGSANAKTARTRLLELRWAKLKPTADLGGMTALQADVDREARTNEPRSTVPKAAAKASEVDGTQTWYPPALRSLFEQIGARRAELTWEQLRAGATAAQLEAYLKEFPKAAARRDVEIRLDDLTWEAAARQATPAAWRGYLERFGSGRHAGEARRLAEAPSWNEVQTSNDEALLKRHLALFAQGATATPARESLAEVVWRRAERDQTDLAPYREYLDLLPSGPRSLAAQDAVDWASAEDDGTVAAVEQYLRRYPDGRFAGHARSALPTLKARASPKVEAAARSAIARIEQQVRSSLQQASARGSVDITGQASASDVAMTVVWQGGGMMSYTQNVPGKDSKIQEAYRLACAFSGKVGPSGLMSLEISNKPRPSLRVDGESYTRTAEGWLRQIEKHFKQPAAKAATDASKAESPK